MTLVLRGKKFLLYSSKEWKMRMRDFEYLKVSIEKKKKVSIEAECCSLPNELPLKTSEA